MRRHINSNSTRGSLHEKPLWLLLILWLLPVAVQGQEVVTLAADDMVVLMSDGLPERFNPNDEMLEDEAAKAFIAGNALRSVQELINGLAKLGDEWGRRTSAR